jgi:hypothetical protein
MRHYPMLGLAAICLVLGGFASALEAQGDELLRKTHRGAREDRVASQWFDNFPTWVSSFTNRNEFLEVRLPLEHVVVRDNVTARPVRDGLRHFRIRDVNPRGMLNIRTMSADRLDNNGRPTFRDVRHDSWIRPQNIPAESMVRLYLGQNIEEVNDLVAFACWLYSQRENKLANRVLTVAHDRSPELAPLIQGFVAEKEGWEVPEDGLQRWGWWDEDTQREQFKLVSAERAEALKTEREREAAAKWRELVAARGEYSGRPPRRRQPTRNLALLEWQVRQFRVKYQATDFIQQSNIESQLQEITDSFNDDRALIRQMLEEAREMPQDNPRNIAARGQAMERALTLDPQNPTLLNDIARDWFNAGSIHDHGNNCDNNTAVRAAVAHFQTLSDMFPHNTTYLYYQARCWQALQNSSNATPLYELILELDGNSGMAPRARAFMRNMEIHDASRGGRRR